MKTVTAEQEKMLMAVHHVVIYLFLMAPFLLNIYILVRSDVRLKRGYHWRGNSVIL